jgi:hypothetical protein
MRREASVVPCRKPNPNYFRCTLYLIVTLIGLSRVVRVMNKRVTVASDLSETVIVFFIYNLNQQSEFSFYKLMLWLLQCLDGESSSGESPVPQIRSLDQFLLSRLFSSLTGSVLRSGFSWVPSLV